MAGLPWLHLTLKAHLAICAILVAILPQNDNYAQNAKPKDPDHAMSMSDSYHYLQYIRSQRTIITAYTLMFLTMYA
jgi:hypothetical protein